MGDHRVEDVLAAEKDGAGCALGGKGRAGQRMAGERTLRTTTQHNAKATPLCRGSQVHGLDTPCEGRASNGRREVTTPEVCLTQRNHQESPRVAVRIDHTRPAAERHISQQFSRQL